MIRVADYIVEYLVNYGINDVFMISGGGAMHLNDAFGRNKNINYICNHHEQASAIGAEGYARITGKLSVVVVTTGPGGTNTLTGLIGQWLDSVPVLYISGQVKFETTIASCPELKLRQLGDQEINIIDIVKPVTKFAAMVTNPYSIQEVLNKAVYIATNGRQGPVWIDIPLNVQGALIDEKESLNKNTIFPKIDFKIPDLRLNEVITLLKNSERPVLIAGNGIRSSDAVEFFLELINVLKIPVVTSFLGCDLINTDHPYFIGRLGTIGNRPGNFAVQNADLIICIGTRNNIRQTSYSWKYFARSAKKIIVDIDPEELKKQTVIPDVPICSDAKIFIRKLLVEISDFSLPDWSWWHQWNLERKKRYSAYLTEYEALSIKVHPYHFVFELTKLLKEGDIIVTANATPSIVYHQLGIIKTNQRVLWNSGCAAMGYGLPAAIGASFGSAKMNNVICLEGEGSLQMNVQELQTVLYHQLPIKLFVLDNQCYLSIKQSQSTMFDKNIVGSDLRSGVSFPDFTKIAEAYGLKVVIIDSHNNLEEKIVSVLNTKGPIVCHVKLTDQYIFAPKTSSEKKPDGRIISKPLEDMFPFLDRTEFLENMIVEPMEE